MTSVANNPNKSSRSENSLQSILKSFRSCFSCCGCTSPEGDDALAQPTTSRQSATQQTITAQPTAAVGEQPVVSQPITSGQTLVTGATVVEGDSVPTKLAEEAEDREAAPPSADDGESADHQATAQSEAVGEEDAATEDVARCKGEDEYLKCPESSRQYQDDAAQPSSVSQVPVGRTYTASMIPVAESLPPVDTDNQFKGIIEVKGDNKAASREHFVKANNDDGRPMDGHQILPGSVDVKLKVNIRKTVVDIPESVINTRDIKEDPQVATLSLCDIRQKALFENKTTFGEEFDDDIEEILKPKIRPKWTGKLNLKPKKNIPHKEEASTETAAAWLGLKPEFFPNDREKNLNTGAVGLGNDMTSLAGLPHLLGLPSSSAPSLPASQRDMDDSTSHVKVAKSEPGHCSGLTEDEDFRFRDKNAPNKELMSKALRDVTPTDLKDQQNTREKGTQNVLILAGDSGNEKEYDFTSCPEIPPNPGEVCNKGTQNVLALGNEAKGSTDDDYDFSYLSDLPPLRLPPSSGLRKFYQKISPEPEKYKRPQYYSGLDTVPEDSLLMLPTPDTHSGWGTDKTWDYLIGRFDNHENY